MSGYTKEPWKVSSECEWTVDHDRYSYYTWAGIESSGETVALAVSHRSDDTMEATARRIVACVNACAGVSTAALEELGGWVQDAIQNGVELMQQRDELLTALKLIAEWRGVIEKLPSFVAKGSVLEDFDDALAAIARAQGEWK